METENKTSLVVIDEAYLLKLQCTDESGIKCFFEVTISKEIEKMSPGKREKLLKRIDEVFYSYFEKFQKDIIHERKSKSVKQGFQKQEPKNRI